MVLSFFTPRLLTWQWDAPNIRVLCLIMFSFILLELPILIGVLVNKNLLDTQLKPRQPARPESFLSTERISKAKDFFHHSLNSSSVLGPVNPYWTHDFIEWQAENRLTAKRRLIFTGVHAGIGNNIRGMLRSYAYAVIHRRLFLVKWTYPLPFSVFVSDEFRSLFEYNALIDSPDAEYGQDSKIFGPSPAHKHGWDGLIPALRGNCHSVFIKTWNKTLFSWSSEEIGSLKEKPSGFKDLTETDARAICRVFLEPSNEMSNYLKRAKRRLGLSVEENRRKGTLPPLPDIRTSSDGAYIYPHISVHARLGAGVGEGRKPRFVNMQGKESSIAERLSKKAEEVSQRLNISSPVIFIASDSDTFPALFKEQVHLRKRFKDTRIVYFEGAHLHSAKLNAEKVGSRIIVNQMFQTFTELRLLAEGNYLISLKSSFADAGFWMGLGSEHVRV